MKTDFKFMMIFNAVCNLPVSIAMSITASLMTSGINYMSWLLSLLGFAIAIALGALIKPSKLNAGFAAFFRLKPETLPGKIVGNVATTVIFTAVILTVMLLINVGPVFPAILFAFRDMYLPLFAVAYIVSLIMTPIALRAAGMKSNHKIKGWFFP